MSRQPEGRQSRRYLNYPAPVTARFDLAIIGGGIIGLATAYKVLGLWPRLRVVVLEKEAGLATHQSGHNTGVIHAGIYYRPGSHRARLCREGKSELETFAVEHGIPFRRCGKIIVALDESELPRLAQLKERGLANGVEGLEEIGPERIREIEPHVAGIKGLYSPGTGVIDFRIVALACAEEVRRRGGEILNGRRVMSVAEEGEGLVIGTSGGEVAARRAVACAGLHSDRVAAMTGDAGDIRVVPFRGDYYKFRPEAASLVRALINPVPDPRFPFLGVHFSRRMDGDVLAGPNAVLAFAREGYTFGTISPRDLAETFLHAGFRRLMREYLATGALELWRDLFKPAYVKTLRRYLPALESRHLLPGPSGVRAQALGRDGKLLDDFSFAETRRVLHVRNAPSPAATASLAIGRHVAERAGRLFGWS